MPRMPVFNKLGPTEVIVKVKVNMPAGPWEAGEKKWVVYSGKKFNLGTKR